MIILIGSCIVMLSVFGGFVLLGGHIFALAQMAELLIIGGAGFGAMIIMAPRNVLIDLALQVARSFRGARYSKSSYEDLFKALYELFLTARRNGMITLEEHIMNPENSPILKKYPSFLKNQKGLALLCGALRPIIDGKVKPDQLRFLLETELDALEEEHHKPVSVLAKTADAMPGFGIVAAVLGIVITMSSIAGPIEQIGHHVAAALVGTFLGILISYGFLNPLAVNMEFLGYSDSLYSKCIATSVIGFANGMAPIMAIELARRGLSSELRPSADELETLLKSTATARPAPAK